MSGWSALTLRFKDEEAEYHSDKVEEMLKEPYDEIRYSDDDRIEVWLGGYGRHKEAVRIITELRDILKEHQIVIDANDTTDSGDGTVYHLHDFGFDTTRRDVYPCEVVHGEQPERGRDVAEEIQNELNLNYLPFSGR